MMEQNKKTLKELLQAVLKRECKLFCVNLLDS